MIRKIFLVVGLLLILLIAACDSIGLFSKGEKMEKRSILDLVCRSKNQEVCISMACDSPDTCPLFSALSSRPVFDFVKTYSDCQDCDTPEFSADRGIGKCIEYLIFKDSTGWIVTIQVSENCSFRYGTPKESTILIKINPETMNIESISPPVEYLENSLYCQKDQDCYCLSGSGVPIIGCSNYFFAL